MQLDFVIYFFFFQAEDGIRDPLVTGVQTCALPISFRSLSLRRILPMRFTEVHGQFCQKASLPRPHEPRGPALGEPVGVARATPAERWMTSNIHPGRARK